MNQMDTLANAKRNEAKLKLLGPTYGIVNIVGNEVIEEADFNGLIEGYLHIRVGITPNPEGSPSVPAFGDYVNSFLVGDTIKRAPNAIEAAKRVALTLPGVDDDMTALARVYSMPSVKDAVETALAVEFR